ncbi:hypothetical protein F5141DRAFT_304631 [Pisolithus sp. B1]|nr:hypothetical protein F5141DRAFT_304631 [Pisolithus sp. B1]
MNTRHSAAAILSRLLVDGAKHCNPRKESINTASPISKLPTELLIEIFTNAFQESCNESVQECEPPGLAAPTYATAFDPHSPSLFPYNIASVCRRWKDVICSSSFPTFWTRVVVVVGITTPGLMQKMLSWSGNLTVGIAVIQDSSPFAIQVEVEDVTRSIVPHIKRLGGLRYSLFRSSDLAVARRTLRGKARRLTYFHLGYEEDDGDGGYNQEEALPDFYAIGEAGNGWKLITHAVQCLNVDNYSFQPACYPKSDGFHDLLRLRSLSLSWPRPRDGRSSVGRLTEDSRAGRIHFREFVAVLQEASMLSWLTVQNEQFDGLDKFSSMSCCLPFVRFIAFDYFRHHAPIGLSNKVDKFNDMAVYLIPCSLATGHGERDTSTADYAGVYVLGRRCYDVNASI